MLCEVESRQEGVGIISLVVDLDRRPNSALFEYQVGECGQLEELRINVKELPQEGLHTVKVDVGVEVEPLKVNIDSIEVLERKLVPVPKTTGSSKLRC